MKTAGMFHKFFNLTNADPRFRVGNVAGKLGSLMRAANIARRFV